MYSAALILALTFWVPFLSRSTPETVDTDQRSSITIKLSKEEAQRIKNTKEIDELVDVAGGIIKRKLAEQKEPTKPTTPHPVLDFKDSDQAQPKAKPDEH